MASRGSTEATPRLRLAVFGVFTVELNDRTLSEDSRRQEKVWRLLKYMLVNRHRRIPDEEFYAILWDGEDCKNPQKALQNLIYRLRMILADEDRTYREAFVQFAKGCYYWQPQIPCELDIQQFDDAEASGLKSEQGGLLDEAARHYLAAIACYRGPLLSDGPMPGWAMASASQYRRKFINVALRAVRILAQLGMHEEILQACHAVLALEPYEEPLHAAYIEALCALSRNREARRHYEDVAVALYKDFGIRPSHLLREACQRIDENVVGIHTDIDVIQDVLAEQGNDSVAFICDADMFRVIYALEARRIARAGQVVYLVLLTFLDANYAVPDARSLRTAMDLLADVLLSTLRRGDVVSRWNDSQFIVMLSSLTYEDCEIVARRIRDRFDSQCGDSTRLILQHKMAPLSMMERLDEGGYTWQRRG